MIPAQRLFRTEHVRQLFTHVMPEGQDWHDALKPEYWFNVVSRSRLAPGDEITVLSADKQIAVALYVLDCNPYSTPVRFDFGVRPIHPLNLDLPASTIEAPPAYRVRQHPDHSWEVVADTGEIVASGLLDKAAAQRACAAFAKRLPGVPLEAAVGGADALRRAYIRPGLLDASAGPEPEPEAPPAKRGRGRPRKDEARPGEITVL